MEENSYIQQKPITHYLQEEDVPKEKREQVLFAISKLVHERNEEVFEAQKTEGEKSQNILASVRETDTLIRNKIKHIVETEDHDESCAECSSQ